MWYWVCPSNEKLLSEHHSYEKLDESLSFHEESCGLEHEYWDDGKPCSLNNCQIPYVKEVSR